MTSAVKVSCLKMTLNEFNSLQKTFDNRIMTFLQCYKLIKRRDPWKSKSFQITLDIGYGNFFQLCSVFYLAMNTNGTLGGFLYHLFSVIYTSFSLLYVFSSSLRSGTKGCGK